MAASAFQSKPERHTDRDMCNGIKVKKTHKKQKGDLN